MKTLNKIAIFWGITMVAIFTILTITGLKWKKNMEPYFNLEDSLVSETKSYYEKDHFYPSDGQSVKVTLSELQEDDPDFALKLDDNTECDGYVEVSFNKVASYKPYIKCPNYTTKGYED